MLLLKSVSEVKATVSSGTLVLASSYAFNAPTLNDCSTHSLLETLPLLSQAVSLENKEDKRTVLLPARLSFQDHGRKKLGHMKEREKERSSFFVWCSPKVPGESHVPGLFLSVWEFRVVFQMYLLHSSIILQGDSRGRQTKCLTPVSFPFLTGPTQLQWNFSLVYSWIRLQLKSFSQANVSKQSQKGECSGDLGSWTGQ